MGPRTALSYAAGSVGFLFIGALHSAVHLAQLSGDGLEERFRNLGTIAVSGQTPESWDLFQGTSLLMGVFSIAIGSINLGTLRSIGRDQPPPPLVGLANMATLAAIIAVGARHLGPIQFYGGLAGLCLFGIGVAANPTSTRPTSA